jgi:hypothetical protein
MLLTREVIISGIIVLLLAAMLPKPDLTIPWQRLNPLYRAPLVHCTCTTVIPGQYFVFVHHGYPLEKHIQVTAARGTLLDPDKFTHIFPGSHLFGVIYEDEGVDERALEAIRRDIGVDMVQCGCELKMGELEEVEMIWDAPPSAIFLKPTTGHDMGPADELTKWYEPSFLGSERLGIVRDWIELRYRIALMDSCISLRTWRWWWQRNSLWGDNVDVRARTECSCYSPLGLDSPRSLNSRSNKISPILCEGVRY